MKPSNTRILALFDTHIPHHIPLGPIFNFIEDWKPTKIILGGDMHDWTSVSQWLGDQSRALDGGLIKENYQELNDTLLVPLMDACGGKAELIYLTGNHEYWLQQAAGINPNGRGYWELEKNLPSNIKIVPINVPYRLNSNLVFIHGLYTNQYHARKTVEAFHVSVIYGHVHTFQQHMLVSPIDHDQFYTGQSVGCLCNLNPSFMKNRPNAWVNGFVYGYTGEKDSFQYVPVVIVRNKFWAEGRIYR